MIVRVGVIVRVEWSEIYSRRHTSNSGRNNNRILSQFSIQRPLCDLKSKASNHRDRAVSLFSASISDGPCQRYHLPSPMVHKISFSDGK